MTKDDLKGKTPNEIVNAICGELGVPEITGDAAEQLREASSAEVYYLAIDVLMQSNVDLLQVVRRMQARCNVCTPESDCAHCVADGMIVSKVLVSIAALARFTQAANVPGSRFQAEAERRSEEYAQRKTDKPVS